MRSSESLGQLAAALAKAQAEGWLKGEVETAFARDGKFYDHDDGVRPDSTPESLAKLKPVFERPWGKVTAGNSSQITDGASWVILASEEAVDHGHARNPQGLKPVDHRMRAADLGLDGTRIGRAAKRIDVGTGNEAGLLGGTDDEAGGALAFQLRQHLVQFLDQVRRKRIGAGALAVEQQPRDAVGIARQPEVLVQAISIGLRPEFEHAIAENVHDL